jgi:geranylgeranyl diphosphate synthase, type II
LTEAKMSSYFEAGFEQFDSISYTNPAYFQELRRITEDLIHREK